jgi:hypothetical protein
MLRALFPFTTAVLIASRAIAAEPIYLTASERLEPYGLADSLTFVAPYFTRVSTTLAVSITKAASSNSNSANTQPQGKQASPVINHAEWTAIKNNSGQITAGQITLKVSCNLKTVLTPNANSLTIEQSINPDYNGTFLVKQIDADSVTLQRPGTKDPTPYHGGGTITDTFCPAQSSGGEDSSYSIVFNTVTVPQDRGYLYLHRNAFFADSVNVGVDNNGMLSSSDSSSQQQVTAILTELTQTASAFTHLFVEDIIGKGAPKPAAPDARKPCYDAMTELLKSGPFFKIRAISVKEIARQSFAWPVVIQSNPKVTITFLLNHTPVHADFERFQITEVDTDGRTKPIFYHSGLVAFLPVPARATIRCDVAGYSPAYLAAPTTLNLYAQRQFVDPQRDFLTNPQDTFSFSGGIITTHKYTDQSPARTVVDTITAPIRALIPSTSVQQTTSVQSQAGKPDQVTSSTQTTTGPPKGP